MWWTHLIDPPPPLSSNIFPLTHLGLNHPSTFVSVELSSVSFPIAISLNKVCLACAIFLWQQALWTLPSYVLPYCHLAKSLLFPSGLTSQNLFCIQIILPSWFSSFCPRLSVGVYPDQGRVVLGVSGEWSLARKEDGFSEAPVEGGGIEGLHSSCQFQGLRLTG